MSRVVSVGIVKAGCIGTLPLLEFLLDERADRKDIEVRVVGAGAKLGPEQCEEVAKKMVDFKPDFAVFTSPNASLPGPTKGREVLREAGIPTIVISDGPTKKIAQDLEEAGFGYIIIDADAMIGARREFLDPAEMSIFNADIIKVLASTGVFNIVSNEIDSVIQSIKRGEAIKLPRVRVNKEKAASAAGFSNPYAKSKAMAAYEISKRVADVTTRGCFVVKEPEKYVPLVAAGHEMMRYAAKLSDEAREIEKGGDSLFRTPHHPDGTILEKRRLMEKPRRPA
ncbi:MAG: F420-dependent methylenetetrahydromethanopterin dehydrogenase [Candidatus Geothermarchaeales archaeon]